VRVKKRSAAFQFAGERTAIFIENCASLHTRAEIAKAAFGRAERDLDIDAEG
jgi:hypothetical protein